MHIRDLGMFTTVDRAPDPGFFIALLDRIQDIPDVQRCRQVARHALRLRLGERILDLGCGTGDETRELARRVQPGGKVVGVDFSRAMIAEAKRRAAGGPRVDFEVGDAQQLRFEDAAFDACRTERMLSHVPDVQAAVAEMVRVTRPGGRVVVIDADADGTIVANPEAESSRALLAALTHSIRNPTIGRQLPQLLSEAGLVGISLQPHVVWIDHHAVEPLVAGVEEWQRWWDDLEHAHPSGSPPMALTMFVALGTKP